MRRIGPCGSLWSVIGQIAAADFVAGSSLHAVVVAESLGIPARLIRSSVEPPFKYEDYYRGSGRDTFAAAASIGEARERGGEHPVSWSPAALLDAFPAHLWAR